MTLLPLGAVNAAGIEQTGASYELLAFDGRSSALGAVPRRRPTSTGTGEVLRRAVRERPPGVVGRRRAPAREELDVLATTARTEIFRSMVDIGRRMGGKKNRGDLVISTPLFRSVRVPPAAMA